MLKKLALFFLLIGFTVTAFGNGSTTVFIAKFWVTSDVSQGLFDPSLSRELESLDRDIFVIRVGWKAYLAVNDEIAYSSRGITNIQFGDYRPLVFTYNDTLDAITADGFDGITLYVLSP